MTAVSEVVDELSRDEEALPAIIWACDSRGCCTHLSQAWTVFTGRTPADDLGWGFLDAIHPHDHALIRETFDLYSTKSQSYQIEYRLRNRNGDYRWVVDTASPQLADGKFEGFFGAIVDNSARKAAEDRLQKREQELKLVTDSVPVLIAHLDRQERYVFANETYRDWFGVDPASLIGKGIADLLEPKTYEETKPYIRSALAGIKASYDTQVTLCDGTIRHIEIVYVPLIASDGSVDGFFAIVSDITERARTHEHLNLIVGELKHHVRNLLSIVRSLASQSFTRDRLLREATAIFQDRLRALAAATDAITPQDVMHADVLEIIYKVVAPYRDADKQRFVLCGDRIEIASTAATGLAMCLHELCTNAIKYGALSVLDGYVEIDWAQRERTVEIVWTERQGPAVSPPSKEGFGSRLLKEAFGSTPGAKTEVRWSPDGLSCLFRIPTGKSP